MAKIFNKVHVCKLNYKTFGSLVELFIASGKERDLFSCTEDIGVYKTNG